MSLLLVSFPPHKATGRAHIPQGHSRMDFLRRQAAYLAALVLVLGLIWIVPVQCGCTGMALSRLSVD